MPRETVLPGHEVRAEDAEVVDAALEVLLDASLDPIVDMVLTRRDGAYEALTHDGRVRFQRDDERGTFEVLAVEGANPLADQSTDKFTPLAAEQALPYPHRSANAYPYAFEQIAQLYDSPSAPDLCVIHSAAHNWEDQGGHLGEHGSIGVVQARAPFVIAGKGVRRDGLVPRSGRLVDVAPTIAALLGAAPLDDDGRYFGVQDGVVRDDVIDITDGRPRHVIGFLFDGTNPNVLYQMAASGEAPNVARLMEMGTAYAHGAMAGLPTVTLANHTSIITSALPGHHGILHNAWYDRASGKQVITNSPATWPNAMALLGPNVDTIHDVVHRTWPDAFSVSVNEPCDTRADYSTFDFMRRGDVPPLPAAPDGLPFVTERFVRPSKDYSWSSVVDHMCVEQALGILSGHYRDVSYPVAPTFMWVNFTLTDAAMHEGGPYSEMAAASIRDSDGRVGAVLDATQQAGIFDDCAFLLVADHGMEQNDRSCQGDWDVPLREAGFKFRDEGYGFLYFGVQ
ncbi:MAG: type phosphodiesterase/nucleotide pyrophosphatase [Actinomycetia bacterium]|nr:type phosphodiesterase/nucleotide pyrophosphatase [Actinomycetes bacterium]